MATTAISVYIMAGRRDRYRPTPTKGSEMKTWGWTLIVAAAAAAGCTPSYRVHVNAFADPNRPVTQGAAVYIVEDPNADNPILRRQIAAKIDELLQGYGYHPVAAADRANYLLTFEAGFNSNQVVDYTPIYRPYGFYYGGFGPRFWHGGLGYTTYVPYMDTVYVHWLRMKLYTKDGAALHETDVVWFGEATTGANHPELRQAVNYLLVACMEHFGIDSGKWATMIIKEDDPRIQGIVAEPADKRNR
jgi:hypothetical protein